MTERSVTHGDFTVERAYDVPPARAFAAWADPEIKRRWFGTPEKDNPAHIFEFKVGGREYNAGKMGEDDYSYDVRYYDIVPDTRIVYAYDMHMNGKRISVSVAAVEFKAQGNGTLMTVTEHGAFLDGLDNVAQRESGTNWLMDQLGEELKRQTTE
jgi:uncharacterized protein YndB with AHSA1/START domain